MSGGVDSSVAACLMQRRGYDCMGATMRLYRNEDIGLGQFHTCCSQKDIDDAAAVAFELDIPYEVLDFTMDFREAIIQKFVHTYEAGGTPNPCIDCNRVMKFDKLLNYALEHGYEWVVTGHYARIEPGENGRWLLKKALDPAKDQSYVLYNLTQHQLAHVLFPLGGMSKPDVRKLAESMHFVNARKHDSQDICFVPDGDYVKFMEQYTGKHYPAGDFLDETGRVVGQHRGAVRYTLGQRKGLGIALGRPVFIKSMDPRTNLIYLGDAGEEFAAGVVLRDFRWIPFDEPTRPIRAGVKIRSMAKEAEAQIIPLPNGAARVLFDIPQRAPAPGQSCVFYDEDYVLGGGYIESQME